MKMETRLRHSRADYMDVCSRVQCGIGRGSRPPQLANGLKDDERGRLPVKDRGSGGHRNEMKLNRLLFDERSEPFEVSL